MKEKSFVQGMAPQAGAALAPQGQPASGWQPFSFGLDALQLRADHLKARVSSVLRSEAFSVAVGFVSAVLMLATLWSLLWIVSIMMGG